MSLSVKTRFEVFKRDRFTCSYCGKHPPEVLLEADHIVPSAAGGSDELDNLTTACVECNRGKGGRMLEEGTAPAINRAAVQEMQERIEQAQAYMQALGALESIAEQQRWRVVEAWARAFRAEVVEGEDGHVTYTLQGNWPDDASVRRFIKKLGLAYVLEAVEIAAARIKYPTMDAVRYFYGVCHTAIREGREPLSRQNDSASVDAQWDEIVRRRQEGAERERERMGHILQNHQEYGFATLEDAIAGMWPTDE